MGVVEVEIVRQAGVAGEASKGPAGPYKMMDLRVTYTADPKHPQNAVITDIDLAPRNKQGLVEFVGDVRIFRPINQDRSAGKLLIDVVNRGNAVALGMMNLAVRGAGGNISGAPDLGDGFMMRNGFTVVQIGWQCDVPPGKGQRLEVPEALSPDGKRLPGRVTVTFNPNTATKAQRLFDRGTHKPQLPKDLNEAGAVLTELDYENGPSRVIPRDNWSFSSIKDGNPSADNNSVSMKSVFKVGYTYQVTYTTEGAPVVGLGFAAVRDMVSFLRHGTMREQNPCSGFVRHAFAFGVSQTGRWLRQFLYLGQNMDTDGRLVFDGVFAHVGGGRRGEFNRRFGLLSDQSKRTLSYLFPYADEPQTDPASGKQAGLLDRQKKVGGLPKIFFTNGAAEYWGSLGSSIHTNIEMTHDIAHGPNVRIYQTAGAQHGSGSLPLSNIYGGGKSRLRQPGSTLDYRSLLRAHLVNLDRWVTEGKEPPPSTHPRITDGTLVAPEKLKAIYAKIPGVVFPEHINKVAPSEYGPGLDPEREYGLKGDVLPVGVAYSSMVASADEDGNEVGGVRLPEVSVPLATHTGWNVRGPDMGQPTLMIGLTGATIPFPPTKAARLATGDPRKSIEERYASKEDFLAKVEAAARALAAKGFLVQEDIEREVKNAGLRYDIFAALDRVPMAV